jgi:polo-like kinase 1
MAAVGEEEEEASCGQPPEPTPPYEAGIRERELATQKARLVSQMAATAQAQGYESTSSQNHDRQAAPAASRTAPRQPLQSARTVPVNGGPVTRSHRSPPGKGKEAQRYAPVELSPRKTRSASRTEKTPEGLFETVGRTLVEAFGAAETPNGYLARGMSADTDQAIY